MRLFFAVLLLAALALAQQEQLPWFVAFTGRAQKLYHGQLATTSPGGVASWSRSERSYADKFNLAPNSARVRSAPDNFMVTSLGSSSAAPVLYEWRIGEAEPLRRSQSLGQPGSPAPDALLPMPERDAVLLAYSSLNRVDVYAYSSLEYQGLWTDSHRLPGFLGPTSLVRVWPEGSVLVALSRQNAVWELRASDAARLRIFASLPQPTYLFSPDADGAVLREAYALCADADEVAQFERENASARAAWRQVATAYLTDDMGGAASLRSIAVFDRANRSALAATFDAASGSADPIRAVSLLTGRSQEALLETPDASVLFDEGAFLMGPRALVTPTQALDAFSLASLRLVDTQGVDSLPLLRVESRETLVPCDASATGSVDTGSAFATYRCGTSFLAVDDHSAYQLELDVGTGAVCFSRYLYLADLVSSGPLVSSAFDHANATLYLAQRTQLLGAGSSGHRLLAVYFEGADCLGQARGENASLAGGEVRVSRLSSDLPSDPPSLFVASLAAASRDALLNSTRSGSPRDAREPCYLSRAPAASGSAAIECISPETGQLSFSQQELSAPHVSLSDAWPFWSARNRSLLLLDHTGVMREFRFANQSSRLEAHRSWPPPAFVHTCRVRAHYEPLSDASLFQWCDARNSLYWFVPGSPNASLELLEHLLRRNATNETDLASPSYYYDGVWLEVLRDESWVSDVSALSVAPYNYSLVWIDAPDDGGSGGSGGSCGGRFHCSAGGVTLLTLAVIAIVCMFCVLAVWAVRVKKRRDHERRVRERQLEDAFGEDEALSPRTRSARKGKSRSTRKDDYSSEESSSGGGGMELELVENAASAPSSGSDAGDATDDDASASFEEEEDASEIERRRPPPAAGRLTAWVYDAGVASRRVTRQTRHFLWRLFTGRLFRARRSRSGRGSHRDFSRDLSLGQTRSVYTLDDIASPSSSAADTVIRVTRAHSDTSVTAATSAAGLHPAGATVVTIPASPVATPRGSVMPASGDSFLGGPTLRSVSLNTPRSSNSRSSSKTDLLSS